MMRAERVWLQLGLSFCSALLLAGCGGGGEPAAPAAPAANSAATPAAAVDGDPAGAGEVRRHALAASTALAVAIPQTPDPMMDGLVIPADAAGRGMWSSVQSWPLNGIHVALLPDGKVLSYGAPAGQDIQDGRTFDVWDPALGFVAASHATSFVAGRVNSFCSAAAFMGDGRLLVSGGNTPRGSSLFTTATRATTTDPAQMADDRWYATMLTLPDGRAVILGGMDPYAEGMADNPDAAIQNGTVSMTPEIYTPGTGWRSLSGARSRDAFGPDFLRASYPRAWVAPNGEVFGISAEKMWYLDVYANADAGEVRVPGNFKVAPSAGLPVNVGASNTAVMFAPGRILQLGGNGAFNGDNLPASNQATVIDINGADPVLSETAPMQFARRYPNAVVLPNGQVVVTGGSRRGNNGGSDAVYAAEIWNPATGSWTLGPDAARIRVYHSNTVLMPNGTVLSVGGGSPGPVFNLNAEVYYPPYLFRTQAGNSVLATRPVMSGINALSHTLGQTVQLEMLNSAAVARMVLVKNSITTHSFNSGQRLIELNFTQSGDRLAISLPTNPNIAPPGYYQLFALDAAGVPSRAVTLQLARATADLPRNTPLSLNATRVSNGVMATNTAGLGVVQVLSANPTAAELSSAQFVARPGLADAACVSLESATQPGRWLRHVSFRIQLQANDSSSGFASQATFCPEPGLAGHSVSLRSKSHPGRLLRERSGGLWVETESGNAAYRNSATWSVRIETSAASLPNFPAIAATPRLFSATTPLNFNPGLDAPGLVFSWSFGDGSPATPFSASSAASYRYTAPGVYSVTLTARNSQGQISSTSFAQAIFAAPTANAPTASSALMLEPRPAGVARLWVVNPDNDSVSVIDTGNNSRIAEITVGTSPRSVALAPNGQVWVVNRETANISVIDPSTLQVVRTTVLPRASSPHGLVFEPNGAAAFVALEALGQVLKLNPVTGAQLGSLAAGPTPRQLSVSADSARLLVSRFITAPLPGEGSANVNTSGNVGGEVRVFNTGSLSLLHTVVLRHSDLTDTEIQGSGIPNYLGPAVISPDGSSAWVPSKQDNIKRGLLRNGVNLDFQNTVRAISSRINLAAATPEEMLAARVDHDNASLASAAAFDPTGSYLFVALETSRQVAVVDAARGLELFRIEAGLAPQGLLVSGDNARLYIHNFMSRNVQVVDLSPLLSRGSFMLTPGTTVGTLVTERLSAQVVKGKQLFYDARDVRLARDSYMSCASCHNDGGQDGRVWDLTGLGEGLRNTINLRGRGGASSGHGRLHWSANFDEVQDFEAQIRSLAGGLGLMSNSQFNTGTRNQPLGDRKAGISADLDALAAYVSSLDRFDASPERQSNGTMTAQALSGRTVFAQQCASCHIGSTFSDSEKQLLHNIGTTNAASGQRLGQILNGIDAPTLRDTWASAPYLHNGAAATVEAAVQAHPRLSLSSAELGQVVAYVRQLGGEEVGAPAPTSNLVVRALATLAQRVGALFDVRVNGSVVGSGQLDATSWVDLLFNVATLVKDAMIDVVFKNDQTIGSEDRNLAVQSMQINGSATVLASAPGVWLDQGTGAGAFDDIDTLPAANTGGWMPWNSALRLRAPATGSASSISVRGRATLAAGVGAQIELYLNGQLIGSRLVSSTVVQDLVFSSPEVSAGDRIDVVFTNDLTVGSEDRNLYVESVSARGQVLAANAPGVLIDQGVGAAAFDGVGTVASSLTGGWIPRNAAFRLTAR